MSGVDKDRHWERIAEIALDEEDGEQIPMAQELAGMRTGPTFKPREVEILCLLIRVGRPIPGPDFHLLYGIPRGSVGKFLNALLDRGVLEREIIPDRSCLGTNAYRYWIKESYVKIFKIWFLLSRILELDSCEEK